MTVTSLVESLGAIALYAALIAALSALEALLPFRRPRGGAARRRANVALTSLYLALNVGLNLGLLLLAERAGFGWLESAALPLWAWLALALPALDFAAYWAHRTMHLSAPLWRVHRVHHAYVHLDATTAFRTHPLEGVWRALFTAAPVLALGIPAPVLAVYRIASGLNAIFEHMNLRLPRPLDRALALLVVTPDMHKVHHSREAPETDTNYGNLFAPFDRLFGTFTTPDRAADCVYGLDGFRGEESVIELLASPLRRPPW